MSYQNQTPAQVLVWDLWPEVWPQLSTALVQGSLNIKRVESSEIRPQELKKDWEVLLISLAPEKMTSFLAEVKPLVAEFDPLPIFFVSAEENYDYPTRLIKMGVNDYLAFPSGKNQLQSRLESLARQFRLTKKVFYKSNSDQISSPFEGIIGNSPKMLQNYRMIQAVSNSNATVLITGGSGTGKELVAKAIHRLSDRVKSPFVDINCGAIPHDLLENELFGHEKGAFTGAHKRYQGSFEMAHQGSLFLDEISELHPLLQVKLLRVLQERSFTRIGGNQKLNVDVRIIAATNRNLHQMISQKKFREDLFYRLNVVNIDLPDLKERREDIPLIAQHFLETFSSLHHRIFIDFTTDALDALINYDWPGNIRELENVIERLVILHDDSQVKTQFLPAHIQKVSRSIRYSEIRKKASDEQMQNQILPFEEIEKQAIEQALVHFRGNVSVAAEKLKIGQATMYRKIKKYGLKEVS